MEIKAKYSIGDTVKVISPKQEEFILSITSIDIRITKEKTQIVYYSKYYTDIDSSTFGVEPEFEIPIHENNEQEGSYSYIKCRVKIVEEK